MPDHGEMTVSEAAKRGGAARKAQRPDYAALGRKGGRRTKERHGDAYYLAIGLKGGAATLDKHGVAHFARLGKLGGAKVKELIRQGKAANGEEIG